VARQRIHELGADKRDAARISARATLEQVYEEDCERTPVLCYVQVVLEGERRANVYD
jgi:hypothetical protein